MCSQQELQTCVNGGQVATKTLTIVWLNVEKDQMLNVCKIVKAVKEFVSNDKKKDREWHGYVLVH